MWHITADLRHDGSPSVSAAAVQPAVMPGAGFTGWGDDRRGDRARWGLQACKNQTRIGKRELVLMTLEAIL